jgi:starch-binding outer membrane protein, SusD/RagB family
VRLNDAADRPTALGYVNAIRERAFGNTTQDITDPELTLALILDERNRELYWECYRRQDLIRFGLFSGGTYLWTWKGGVLAGQATDSHLDVYPVPATQIAANPNLQQNPGY